MRTRETPTTRRIWDAVGNTLATLLVLACSPTTETIEPLATGEILLPDTATVDGVLRMRHGPTAFARAPQLRPSAEPLVVYSDRGNPAFDLTLSYPPVVFRDGRTIVAVRGLEPQLLQFQADGRPDRVIAVRGDGPGDIRNPRPPIRLTPDTVLVADRQARRINFVTADRGIVASEMLVDPGRVFCVIPVAVLPGRRLLAADACWKSTPGQRERGRIPIAMMTLDFDYADPGTLVILPGYETVDIKTRPGEVSEVVKGFSHQALYAAWAGGVATNPLEPGFRIEYRRTDGILERVLVVDMPRRVVTATMRQGVVAHALEMIESGRHPTTSLQEARRSVREQPFADSLPAFEAYHSGTGGLLWAILTRVERDTETTAVAFRSDGAIVGVLRLASRGTPVAFGDQNVMLRETDEDGVVRYELYRINGIGAR